jgi:hypothetical protein
MIRFLKYPLRQQLNIQRLKMSVKLKCMELIHQCPNCTFEAEIAIEKSKRYKSPGINQNTVIIN